MSQKIKTLLENDNFRNNQNYIFWNKLKSKILSLNNFYTKMNAKYMIFVFIFSIIASFYIILNILHFNEPINIMLLMPIMILFVFFFTNIVPKIYNIYFSVFINNSMILLSINNIDYKEVMKQYKEIIWDFKYVINENFIILNKNKNLK